MSRKTDSWLPKELLECAPAEGAQSVGGPKCHWNDVVRHDLVKCGLEQDWHELAQDRSAWRGVVKTCVDIVNEEAEYKEDRKEDGRKSTQQSHLTAAMAWLLL